MQLPLNRIRQIINLDEESTLISKEALMLITKATEYFVQDLGGLCAQVAKHQKRKTMQVNDILTASQNMEKYYFIKDSKLPTLSGKSQKAAPTMVNNEEADDAEMIQELESMMI